MTLNRFSLFLRDHRRRLRRLRIGQDEIPDDMICPISFEVMKDPVMAQDGHTYERVCIEEWFQTGARTCRDTDYACHAVDASRFAAHAC